MALKSVTREVIATISAGACLKALKLLGFKRTTPHFWREVNGINHAINFQASAFGTKEGGSFAVNLGVSTRPLYETFTGNKFPSNRGTALWPIQVRLGLLIPASTGNRLRAIGADRWWRVDERASADDIGQDVVENLLRYAIPFFETFGGSPDIEDYVSADRPLGLFPAQIPLVLATLDMERGDRQSAEQRLRNAIAERSESKPFHTTIYRVAERLGLDIT